MFPLQRFIVVVQYTAVVHLWRPVTLRHHNPYWLNRHSLGHFVFGNVSLCACTVDDSFSFVKIPYGNELPQWRVLVFFAEEIFELLQTNFDTDVIFVCYCLSFYFYSELLLLVGVQQTTMFLIFDGLAVDVQQGLFQLDDFLGSLNILVFKGLYFLLGFGEFQMQFVIFCLQVLELLLQLVHQRLQLLLLHVQPLKVSVKVVYVIIGVSLLLTDQLHLTCSLYLLARLVLQLGNHLIQPVDLIVDFQVVIDTVLAPLGSEVAIRQTLLFDGCLCLNPEQSLFPLLKRDEFRKVLVQCSLLGQFPFEFFSHLWRPVLGGVLFKVSEKIEGQIFLIEVVVSQELLS